MGRSLFSPHIFAHFLRFFLSSFIGPAAQAPHSQVHLGTDSDSIFSERPVCTTGFRPGPERSYDMARPGLENLKRLEAA